MKEKIENVLFQYGAKVLIEVRELAEELELYEDCALINEVLTCYNIETTFSLEDWRCEFWKLGLSGEIALSNREVYFAKAVGEIFGNRIINIFN